MFHLMISDDMVCYVNELSLKGPIKFSSGTRFDKTANIISSSMTRFFKSIDLA